MNYGFLSTFRLTVSYLGNWLWTPIYTQADTEVRTRPFGRAAFCTHFTTAVLRDRCPKAACIIGRAGALDLFRAILARGGISSTATFLSAFCKSKGSIFFILFLFIKFVVSSEFYDKMVPEDEVGTSGTKGPQPESPFSPSPSISSRGDSWIKEAYGDGGEVSSSAPHQGKQLQGGSASDPSVQQGLFPPPQRNEAGPSTAAGPGPSGTPSSWGSFRSIPSSLTPLPSDPSVPSIPSILSPNSSDEGGQPVDQPVQPPAGANLEDLRPGKSRYFSVVGL
jgi:hypothetical protein